METDSINPFRYRGYYYDTETGFYYLQTRYYDPRTGRFINADALSYLGADGELRGYNLYTYCGNNPVMRVDPEGHAFCLVTLATIFIPVLINLSVEVYRDYKDGNGLLDKGWDRYLIAGASGLASGIVSAVTGGMNLTLGKQLLVAVITDGLLSTAEELYYDIKTSPNDINVMRILDATLQGITTAAIGFALSKIVSGAFAVSKTKSIIKSRRSSNLKINHRLASAGYGDCKIGIDGFDGVVDTVMRRDNICQAVDTAVAHTWDLFSGFFF